MLRESPAAERNKGPILEVLKELIEGDDRAVLEVGSGTGQHGEFFAGAFPGLDWIYTDRPENLVELSRRQEASGLANLKGPVEYAAGTNPLPAGAFDLLFSANTFHIMGWKEVKTLIKEAGKNLGPGARFVVYGPFRYADRGLEPSNENFDQMLKARDPKSGIRLFEDVKNQAENRGFRLLKDYSMPANNRLLAFIKI